MSTGDLTRLWPGNVCAVADQVGLENIVCSDSFFFYGLGSAVVPTGV